MVNVCRNIDWLTGHVTDRNVDGNVVSEPVFKNKIPLTLNKSYLCKCTFIFTELRLLCLRTLVRAQTSTFLVLKLISTLEYRRL